jgi:hypothetical protein
MRLIFGELNADQPGHLNGGLLVAKNCYKGRNGYRPVKAFSAVTNGTLVAECLGAAAFRSANNVTHLFAGTASNLYRHTSGGWTSVGSGYSASDEIGWAFAQFGNLVIATNGIDPPQKFDLGTVGSFAPLGGTPPTMRILAVVRDFLVGGYIDGDTAAIQWSAINDAENWTAGNRQGDYNIFPSGGAVSGLANGEYGLVFQQRSIKRMVYTGGDTVFQFQEISNGVGCVSDKTLAQFGNLVFFRSDQGFAVCDGQSVEMIGDERVDRTFEAAVVRGNFTRVSAAVDPINKLYIVTEPSSSNPTRWWVYSITQKAWTVIEQGADRVFSGFSADTTLEDLDSLFATLELVTPGLDSATWVGGTPALYVVDNSHILGTMSGANMEATFETGDLQLIEGRKSRLRELRPMTDADQLTVTDSYRDRLADAVATTSATTLSSSGRMKLRKSARYHRLKLVITAGDVWTFAQGFDEIAAELGGGR